MKWEAGRRSANVEDLRAERRPRRAQLGCGGLVVLLILAVCFGINPLEVMSRQQERPSRTQKRSPTSEASRGKKKVDPKQVRPEKENELADFVSVVLADTEDTWNPIFRSMRKTYVEPKLVLFTGQVKSACGFQSAATGPFYCGRDKKAYIDLSFYEDLRKRHGAPGDFAQAYVIAHEVGHHVQNLLGTSKKVRKMKVGKKKAARNELSVRHELQADCLAGIWAHHAKKVRDVLDKGDIDEALRAASGIGDDRLQMKAKGYVTPESFTHGTAAQRTKWFKIGFKHGRLERCDTFKTKTL